MPPRPGPQAHGVAYIAEWTTDWRDRDPQLPLFASHWESGNPDGLFVDGPGWDSLDSAIAWGRERAPEVYVRVGRTAPQVYFSAGAINGGPTHGDERIPNWPPSVDDLELIQLQGSDEPEEQQAPPTESKRLALLDTPEIIRLDDNTAAGLETLSEEGK